MTNRDFAKRIAIVILAIVIVIWLVVLFVDIADGGLDDSGYLLLCSNLFTLATIAFATSL